jgi:DNA-binding FadR family transcriptional regulator
MTTSARANDGLANRLAESVLRGEPPAGALLPSENELGRVYRVSRPTMRETIRRLAASGLVETRPGLGSVVNPPARWNLFDPLVLHAFVASGSLPLIAAELVELRRTAEVEAAGLAADRARPEKVAEMRLRYEQMSTALHRPDVFAEADIAFHDAIVEACGNRFLVGIFRYVAEPLREARRVTAIAGGPLGLAQAQDHHRRIVEAIAAHDPAAARNAMRAHLAQSADDLRQALVAHPAAIEGSRR